MPLPRLPYPERRQRSVPNLDEIWGYINPYMLFGRHLGFKGNFEKLLAGRDPKALELHHQMEEVKAAARGFMSVRVVWQYFEAESASNDLYLFDAASSQPAQTFTFGRQDAEDGLSLADYVLPPDNGNRDQVAIFVVTAGEGIREKADEWKEAGEFLRAHAIQALALETAEGCAEWLHRRIREDWGFPDPPEMTMKDRFTSKYRGKRYSFGYPACPRLEDQAGIWKLLRPEEIGVQLTDGFMMEPEASVSALVFHHPDCTYFGVADVAETVAAQ